MRRLVAASFVLLALAILIQPEPVSCAATSSELLAGIRAARGDIIPTNGLLNRVAEVRADQIVTNFSHDDGGVRDEMLPPGLHFAEILAWNSYPEGVTEAEAITQWMGSPGHRGVLLGQWTHVGVGVADADPKHFYAAIFAEFPREKSLPATDC